MRFSTITVSWLTFGPLLVVAGSCREAQLCCNGRDSSCVVQKAPTNAIIEDLNEKPCYCDHACLKLGDCCADFKDHCGVLDCEVGYWSQWSECDNSCGKGSMTRTRPVMQAAQNGGKHCPTLQQKRACRGYNCRGNLAKKILRETALLLPAATSNRWHMNSSHTSHGTHDRNYRHQDNDYCVEFEVFKTAKSCQSLPPYNLLQEGDRIIIHCSLAAVMQDKSTTVKPILEKGHKRRLQIKREHLQDSQKSSEIDVEQQLEEETESEVLENEGNGDEENELDSNESEQDVDYDAVAISVAQNITSTTLSPTKSATRKNKKRFKHNLRCIGEGLSGHITRWSALPAPSCRGKWLRLSLDPPKKCTNSQFIFV